MPPMTNNETQDSSDKPSVVIVPYKDVATWEQLYDRIRVLALRRSTWLIHDELCTDDQFDRGARTLRTLMGAAEIARRIKTSDEKEKTANGEERKPPAFTDDEIRTLYRTVSAQVERMEREDAEGADTAPGDPSGGRGGGGPGSRGPDVGEHRS